MPPPYLHPGTPKSKNSSAGILSTFRTLTGQRKSQSSSSTVSTAGANSVTSTDYIDSSPEPANGTSTRGPDEPLKAASTVETINADFALDDDPFLGMHDLGIIAARLGHGFDRRDRRAAARATAEYLQEHKVTHVGKLWFMGSDLLDEPLNTEDFQAALQLYTSCIKQDGLTGPDRRILFDALAKQLSGYSQECVRCFGTLTNRGRNFEGLEMGRVANLLAKLVKASSEATSDARRRIRKEKSGSSAPEDTCFDETFALTADALKFNATLFTESQLETILAQVFGACRKTSLESELARALRILDALATYCIIPSSSLRPLLEVLCGIYCSVESPTLPTMDVLWKVMKSYHASAAVIQLQAILVEGPKIEGTLIHSLRGSVRFLHQVFLGDQDGLAVELTLGDFMKAMASSLNWLDVKLERDVLDVLQDLINRHQTFMTMLTDDVWPSLVKLVERCASSEAMRRCSTIGPAITPLTEVSHPEGTTDASESNFLEAFGRLTYVILQNTASGVNTENDVTGSAEDRKRLIMPLLLKVADCLDESTLEALLAFYDEEKLHTPPREDWLETCRSIHVNVFRRDGRPPALRVLALNLMKEAYSIAVAFGLHESEALLREVLPDISETTNRIILQPLITMVVEIATWTDDFTLFDALTLRLQEVLLQPRTSIVPTYDSTTLRASNSVANPIITLTPPDTPTVLIARGLVKMFLRTVHKSYPKTNKLYSILLSIAQSSEPPTDARITVLKVLVRLRADVYHAVFVVPHTESESLAAALCRTADSAVLAHINAESPINRPVRTDDASSRNRDHGNSTNNTTLSRSNSTAGRSSNQTSRLTKATPPLWMYPGPKGIPEEPYYFASHVTYTHVDSLEIDGSSDTDHRGTLDIGIWLEVVVQIINSPGVDWEIFSYIIVHLGGQLANHALFVDAVAQIKLLRRTICEKLSQRNYVEPPAYSNLKKSDAAVCLYQILTMLVSYAEHFGKDDEQDAVVKAFVLGIGSWERTSEICIHGLTICCHEMPSILVRYLDTTLHRMTQIITQMNVAASILEFLATLARLPELFRNFREDDFKTVFGICFRYLQYSRDTRDKQSSHTYGRSGRTAVAGLRGSRDLTSPVDNSADSNSLGEALPQYVYALAFHVMTFWFMALKLQDRPKHVAWITKNLKYKDEHGLEAMEEQGEVTIDMMFRVAYSDRDETMPDPDFAKAADGNISTKNFLLGTSILSVETAGRTGVSQLTTRRASGTTYSIYRPLIAHPPRHQTAINIGLAADAFYSAEYVGVTPDHIIQTLYSPLCTNPEIATSNALPLALPEDDATRRAISSFDRIPALDGHKAGIIYVGEGQKDEATILANVMGSADYMDFLNGIGTLTELKDATINTHGLDREFGSDGKFTYCWRDRVTELVFHVTTMMPTNNKDDASCSHKKKHIGNDYVNIIFNNSGSPFDPDTFRSDFNYVNIVITPEARASFVETRLQATRLESEGKVEQAFYKVTTMIKPGLPRISPAAETKVISGSSLPAFVRLMALNASVFSNVWANRGTGENPSSWRSRLAEIKRLRSRNPTSATVPWGVGAAEVGSPPQTASSGSEAQGATRNSTLLRRTSVTTFFSEGTSTKRSSGISGLGDLEHD